jgi:hypothetical protein
MSDAGGGSANAKPDPDHVPLDAEAKALKLEQTKAESRKAIALSEQAIADAQKKTLLAKLPSSDVKPLEGKIDIGEKGGCRRTCWVTAWSRTPPTASPRQSTNRSESTHVSWSLRIAASRGSTGRTKRSAGS